MSFFDISKTNKTLKCFQFELLLSQTPHTLKIFLITQCTDKAGFAILPSSARISFLRCLKYNSSVSPSTEKKYLLFCNRRISILHKLLEDIGQINIPYGTILTHKIIVHVIFSFTPSAGSSVAPRCLRSKLDYNVCFITLFYKQIQILCKSKSPVSLLI